VNASFDGESAEFSLESDTLVLIDPIALDGLASEIIKLSAADRQAQVSGLAELGQRGLRIGLHRVPNFKPGMYRVNLNSFKTASVEHGPGVFEIDTGTVVIIDLSALGLVAQALTWDRYDELLQAESGDHSLLSSLNAEVGRPAFALISADSASAFTGDGAFELVDSELRRV
jgi:hypothetical protein